VLRGGVVGERDECGVIGVGRQGVW
jgi:hypothetical protein